VIVCDGFSGNIALKSMEGTAKLIRHFLELEFRAGIYRRLAGLVAWPVLKSLGRRLDPRRYNGASLVGLNGIVIKSHGGADVWRSNRRSPLPCWRPRSACQTRFVSCSTEQAV
jgi:glycerol-3-phosphate acyltransferase PlsX